MRVNAAIAARALSVPAARIRQWASRGQICRYPDGTLDSGCIATRVGREAMLRSGLDYQVEHDTQCGVLRATRKRVTLSA